MQRPILDRERDRPPNTFRNAGQTTHVHQTNRTLTGRTVHPAVRAPKAQGMLSSPQIISSVPICFSHLFDSWKQHRSGEGGQSSTAFFASRSGRSEAQSLDWTAVLRKLAREKMGGHPFPYPPSLSRTALFFCPPAAAAQVLCHRGAAPAHPIHRRKTSGKSAYFAASKRLR